MIKILRLGTGLVTVNPHMGWVAATISERQKTAEALPLGETTFIPESKVGQKSGTSYIIEVLSDTFAVVHIQPKSEKSTSQDDTGEKGNDNAVNKTQLGPHMTSVSKDPRYPGFVLGNATTIQGRQRYVVDAIVFWAENETSDQDLASEE